MKSSSPLSVTCGLFLFSLCGGIHAANHYEWYTLDDEAQWGDQAGRFGTAPNTGTLTRSVDAISTVDPWSYSPINLTPTGASEGPYDGSSSLIQIRRGSGVFTRTDATQSWDLSPVGSTAILRTMYFFMDNFPDSGGILHNWEYGLTSNEEHFGHPSDDSLFVAGRLDMPHVQFSPGTYDAFIFDDDTIDQTPTDGIWDATGPMATIATDIPIEGLRWEPGDPSGTASLVELQFTNIGGGQMRVDHAITAVDLSGVEPSDTFTSFALASQGSNVVDHGLTDLTNLRPGVGFRTNDSDHPNSGAGFDWHPEYDALIVIPEPGSTLMALIGGCLLFFRRKRR